MRLTINYQLVCRKFLDTTIITYIYIYVYTNMHNISSNKTQKGLHSAAGPESIEGYFQKGAILGQKAALNLWYLQMCGNSFCEFGLVN